MLQDIKMNFDTGTTSFFKDCERRRLAHHTTLVVPPIFVTFTALTKTKAWHCCQHINWIYVSVDLHPLIGAAPETVTTFSSSECRPTAITRKRHLTLDIVDLCRQNNRVLKSVYQNWMIGFKKVNNRIHIWTTLTGYWTKIFKTENSDSAMKNDQNRIEPFQFQP